MESKPNIENNFLKRGYKSTKQRQAVMEILENAVAPLSAEDIFMPIKSIYPSIALSTVYRNLEIMLEKGLVKKDIYHDGKARYKITGRDDKHHLFCVKCSKLIPLEECPLGAFKDKLKAEMDFEMSGHNIQIYGYCSDCKK